MDNRDYLSKRMKTVSGQLLRIWAGLTVELSSVKIVVTQRGPLPAVRQID
jgi:hypothetical protein